jgi:LCP family protein required for cell wall assembly
MNVLIVGTDSADGLPDDDPVHIGRDGGVRTDTIMLLRVDPKSSQASLLSLPRDLYVHIAGTGGTARINAAIQGGPSQLVATITDDFDLPVHHYIEVNFAGFQDLVDAIGGVPVYFPEPVRDKNSGLDVPDPGCVTLDPQQALAFARARHYETYRDGRWEVDGSGDFGRIARQQDFIRLALHRAFERGARNPTVLADLVQAGVQAITLDSTLTIGDLSQIALAFRNFDPDHLVTYGLPVSDAVADGADVLRLDTTRAQPIFDVFRGEDPDRVSPDNTVVSVSNGTPTTGAGAAAADRLRDLGFVLPPDNVGDAETTDVAQTTVHYRRGKLEQALLLAAALPTDPVLEEDRNLVGADVQLVLGADFTAVGTRLRAIEPPDTDGSSTSTSSSTTVPAGPTTSTSIYGEVPAPPPAGTSC